MRYSLLNLMSAGQAAKRAGVSVWSIINWCKRHKIGVNIGGHWIVLKQRLKSHLANRNKRRTTSRKIHTEGRHG